jgi:putative flippase GtrA
MKKVLDVYKNFMSKFNVRETLSYTWVGFVGIGLDLVFFFILREVAGLNPVISTMCSAAIAATLTFPLNLKFTFQKNDNIKKRFYMYVVINFIGLLLGAALIYLGYDILGINDKFVKLGSTVVVAGTQFLLNKFIAFK